MAGAKLRYISDSSIAIPSPPSVPYIKPSSGSVKRERKRVATVKTITIRPIVSHTDTTAALAAMLVWAMPRCVRTMSSTAPAIHMQVNPKPTASTTMYHRSR